MNKEKLQYLIRHLENLPKAKYGNAGLQIKTQCPWCDNDSNKTHLSIKTDFENDQPLVYQCWRASCRKTGIVDAEFLMQTNATNPSIFLELAKYNKKAKVITKGKFSNIKNLKKHLEIIPPRKTNINRKKYLYVCDRLGKKLSLKELKDFKIIIDPIDFLEFNNITLEGKNVKYYKAAMHNGIGFLSIDNTTLTIRRVDKKAYVVVKLFDDVEGNKIYVIPSMFNLLSKDKPILNISEGSFDIISVFLNMKNTDKDNVINTAVSGGINYNSLIYFIKSYGLIDRLRINIFGDKDVSVKKYKNAIKEIKRYVLDLDIYLYYNVYPGEKDFGVPPERIKIDKHKLA